MLSRRAFLVAVFAVCFAATGTAQPQAPAATRILFIGNSYTYFHNLPAMVAALAADGHHGRVDFTMAAPGGWRLKDHWEKGTLPILRRGKWDFVVLQEQSTLGFNYFVDGETHVGSDEVFRPYAEKWAAEIRAGGGTPVFYLTWSRRTSPGDQSALNYAYTTAAKAAAARVAPVGIAWAEVREQYPDFDLYASDGSHPSSAGSYLAACVLYATIFHANPVGLTAQIRGPAVEESTGQVEKAKPAVLVDLPPDRADILQTAAWNAYQSLLKRGGYPEVRPPMLAAPELPAGATLSMQELEGGWSGNLSFYPGVGPVRMTLELRRDGTAMKGHLEIVYPVKDFANESLDLADLQIGPREITFSDPSSAGVAKLAVKFRGILTNGGEIRGTAEARRLDPALPPVIVLGVWKLRRER